MCKMKTNSIEPVSFLNCKAIPKMLVSRTPMLFVAFAVAVGGCASKSITVTRSEELHGRVGQRVVLVGTAMHGCPGAMLFGESNCCVFIEGMKYWPARYDRQMMRVAGLLVEHQQPDLYFIRHAKLTTLGKSGSNDGQDAQKVRELLQVQIVTDAINRGDWKTLRRLVKPGMKAEDFVKMCENAQASGHAVRIGKLVSSGDANLKGTRCSEYCFVIERQDGTPSPHYLQLFVQQDNRSQIIDFWNFGW